MDIKKQIFKVALVGCGAIAGNHLSALSKLENAEITALCDIDRERAERARDKYSPSAAVFTDLDTMLNCTELDAVHIATPHYLHAPMALKALERGLNVFLEKPMCISTSEIDALIDADKKSKGKLCVCFQNRFNATTALAKKIIEEDGGALGAYATVIWERDVSYYTDSPWRGSWEKEGGGVLINQAIHSLDLLCELLGRPEYLYATTANHHLKGIIEVEDSSEGLIVFESGKRASFYATTAFSAGNNTRIYIRTANHSIEISDSEICVDKIRQNSEIADNMQIGKDCYGKGHYTLISEFYRSLEENSEAPVTPESAQWALRILLAAYRSNDKKTKI